MSEAMTAGATAAEPRRTGIARRVRGLMGEQRISGERAGAAIGVSNGALSRRVTGHVEFGVGEIETLAELFNVSEEYLYGFTNDRVRHVGLEPTTR